MTDPDDKNYDPAPGPLSTVPNGQGNLPLRERIQTAKEEATRRRVELGLPAETDDGPFTEALLAARAKARKRKR